MSQLTSSIPPDAQAFMDRVKNCTTYESIQATTPNGIQAIPIFPGSKIIGNNVVQPDNIRWSGQKPDRPYYLVMVQTPKHRPNECDWWWFSMELTLTVDASAIDSEGCSQTLERSHPKEIQAIAGSSDPQS